MTDNLICKVKQGQLLYDQELLARYLKKYEGAEVMLTLRKHDPDKSMAQRGYYFAAIVRDAAEHFGWEPEDMHDYLKEECNKKELVNSKTGEIYTVAGSTVPLKKMDMMAFIDRSIRRLAEMGYVVHTPEEYFAAISYKGTEIVA